MRSLKPVQNRSIGRILPQRFLQLVDILDVVEPAIVLRVGRPGCSTILLPTRRSRLSPPSKAFEPNTDENPWGRLRMRQKGTYMAKLIDPPKPTNRLKLSSQEARIEEPIKYYCYVWMRDAGSRLFIQVGEEKFMIPLITDRFAQSSSGSRDQVISRSGWDGQSRRSTNWKWSFARLV